MEKVINLGIPHVGELIFESIDTPGLIECTLVSKTWKVLAENVLLKRWEGGLFEACYCGKTEIVRILLERSENIDIELKGSINGMTALMLACKYGHKYVVQMLLYHSYINFNIKCYTFGDTAFTYACRKGHREIVKLLMDHSDKNIKLDARDNFGRTAFMWACFNGHTDVCCYK